MPEIKIAPSILSADFTRMNEEIAQVEGESDLIHVDIMDGKFVPPTTVDSDFVKTLKTKAPLDIHLMVEEPSEEYLLGYIEAGASSITVHVEACEDPDKQIDLIRKKGCKACIALKPKTPVEAVKPFLDKVDMVLVMTVEPGWAGQSFMKDMMPKVEELRKLKPELDIQVDGGISAETGPLARKAGANVFVAATAIFGKDDRLKAAKELRQSVQ